MKSLLTVSRLILLVLTVLLSGAGAAAASGEPPMKMPVDGACKAPYILFEGVCVIPAFMQGQPATIMDQIKAFKKAHDETDQDPAPKPANPDEDPLCARYRKILEDHLKKKAMTFNPDSREMEKARGQSREAAIEEAREYLINFCHE